MSGEGPLFYTSDPAADTVEICQVNQKMKDQEMGQNPILVFSFANHVIKSTDSAKKAIEIVFMLI